MTRSPGTIRPAPAALLALLVVTLILPHEVQAIGTSRGRSRLIEWPINHPHGIAGVRGAARFDRGNREGTTVSGVRLKGQAADSSWLLYPDACTDLGNGTWNPRSTPAVDRLDTYSTLTTGPYQRIDLSLSEVLWHVSDTGLPAGESPPVLDGSRSLWCGKYDPIWPVKVGYPNSPAGYQILYLDTGSHASDYDLTLLYRFSTEIGYDHVYLIGGGGGLVDPIGNRRDLLDVTIALEAWDTARLLVSWTGSFRASTAGATNINTTFSRVWVVGSGASPPEVLSASIRVAAEHRALYFVFVSDEEGAAEDGAWPYGQGQVLDLISTSDNGMIYGDQVAAGGTDLYGGQVIVGSPTNPVVSARVPPGAGELWQLVDGSEFMTPDWCSSQKWSAADRMFFGGDVTTKHITPHQSNAFVTCAIPVPAGTASLAAMWDEYVNLPEGSGFVGDARYRYHKDGLWSNWSNVFEGGGSRLGGSRSWETRTAELAEAVQADSVMLWFGLSCVRSISADGANCDANLEYGILYDNLRLAVTTGTPLPLVDVFPGSLPQTTFVDGTMTGWNCTVSPCWPGIRGSDLSSDSNPDAARSAIRDNFNSPLGDSITVTVASGLRKNGMGVNWRHGYDKSFDGGLTIAHVNASYNPAFDTPRMIYRLFDPATKTWSPWDSTELDADAVSVSGQDTVVAGNAFRVNWPPRDKVAQALPGGFTINGQAPYNNLRFLPRGCRMEYGFKGVDVNGGVSYAMNIEIEELEPITPGGHPFPWWIWCVLPGVYPPGAAGSLLAGQTGTPVLNLDGAYGAWSQGTDIDGAYGAWRQGIDPVTEALRGMGVRADRYRLLQGFGMGSNIGGHELPENTRPRLRSNYFPNIYEYGIRESLATWYRIIIQSSHVRTTTLEDEQDARLLEEWWNTETGPDGGDRCIFASGDDYFNALLTPRAEVTARRVSYAQNVFGVAAVAGSWAGSGTTLYPAIEDGFANPGSGPTPVPGYSYPVDGACPRPNRFDALTKMGLPAAQSTALYPLEGGTNDVSAVAQSTEKDAVADSDHNKALGYGFSIQYLRKAGIPVDLQIYPRSGAEERLRVLYKFLTSCRGGASGAAACWPCPTDPTPIGNWAGSSSFDTGTYGPLYPIKDPAAATGILEEPAPGAPGYANALAQNRPNPFNPRTVIRYSLSARGAVRIQIFDVSGRLVRTLVDERKDAGWHEAPWNGRTDNGTSSASGMYFYRIAFPDGTTSSRKMVVLR